MKKTTLFIIAILLIAGIFVYLNYSNKSTTGNVIVQNGNPVNLILFYGEGCPHCAQFEEFLNKTLQPEFPSLHVQEYEVYNNNSNRLLFDKMAQAYGGQIEGVPTMFIGDKVFVGYSGNIGKEIESQISNCLNATCELKDKGSIITIIGSAVTISTSENPETTNIKRQVTIPAVVAAGFVDSINPCAFAVLIILMSTVLASGNRKRALFAGLAFAFAIFISYFLMGLGLYSAIKWTGFSRQIFYITPILAILVGLFNLKDYFFYGLWFKMEVPDSWRPKMKMLLKGVTSVPGAFGVGVLISLILLPCTSGPYIVILSMLAETSTRTAAIPLMLLHNLIFVLPMIIITFGIYFGYTNTEDAENWRTRKLRMLHLIAGIILIVLGIGMFIGIRIGWL